MAVIQELTVKIGGDLRGASNAFRRVSRQASAMGRNISQVGRGLTTSLTLPLAAAAGTAAGMASRFEDEFGKITGLVGIAADQTEAFRQEILKLAPAVGRGPQELAEALFVVTSAGARGREAMEILEASAKGASAGLGQTRDVARAVTAAVATFADDGLSAAQATDTLTAAVRAGNLEASSLAGTLGSVIGTAKAAGASFADVGAAIAVMSRQGISAEEGTTALNAVFQLLIKTTKQSRDALAQVGLSTEGLREQLGEEGLLSVLRTLDGALEGNVEAMGEAIPNVRALRSVLSILGQDADDVGQIFDDVANSTGVLEEAFVAAKTPGFRMRQALAQIQASGITLGDSTLPGIATAATVVGNAISRLVDAFKGLSAEQRRTVLITTAVAGALGPMLFITGKLISAFGVLAGTVGKSLTVLAAMLTPIGALVAALTGTVAIAYLFRDELMRSFTAVRDFIGTAFQNMVELAQLFRDKFTEAFDSIRTFLQDKFVTPIAIGFDKFLDVLKGALERMVEFVRPVLEFLGVDIDRVFEKIKGSAANMADSVKGAFNLIGESGAAAGEAMGRGALEGFRMLRGAGREVARRAETEFASLKDRIQGMFTGDLFQGLATPPGGGDSSLAGMESQLDRIAAGMDQTSDAGEEAADNISGSFSRLGEDIGRSVGEAVVRGKNLLESLGNIARRVLSQLIGSFVTKGILAMFGLPGMATGGRLQGNTPTLVGERGPELVTSKRPLTVMNNADTKGALGRGGGPIINFNGPINADDAIGVRRAVTQGVMEGIKASAGISREQIAAALDTGI